MPSSLFLRLVTLAGAGLFAALTAEQVNEPPEGGDENGDFDYTSTDTGNHGQ